MDSITNSVSSVQKRTPTKRSKPKKKNAIKPIKVVYISNPMKVKTSASEFRALVQELTGQDAKSPPDPSRYGGDDGNLGGGNHVDSDDNFLRKNIIGHGENYDETILVPPQIVDTKNCTQQGLGGGGEGSSPSMDSFEPFDEFFTPQMIGNISALLPPSVFYESPQVDHQEFMRCNYIHHE